MNNLNPQTATINRACIFSHFDKDALVDDYVYYYLQELFMVCKKIIFVTVVDISSDDIKKLESMNIDIIKRINIGYDFYSYKVGIDTLNLNEYDELILCNDSVYGPVLPIDAVFHKMSSDKCDFWGMTGSNNISYHIQSYFIVYRKNILRSLIFSSFWENLLVIEDKAELIKKYEIGLSSLLLKSSFTASTFVNNVWFETSKKDNVIRLVKRLCKAPYKVMRFFISPYRYLSAIKQKSTNLPLIYWEKLLLDHGMPFIKISLFTKSPERLENSIKLESLFCHFSNYPANLILKHLERVNKSA